MTAANIIQKRTNQDYQKVWASIIDSDDNLLASDNPLPSKVISSALPTGASTEEKQDDIISALNNSSLSITNAIDETAYDLNSAAFSETTNISNDYILDNIELNFSTTEEKTITITTSDGTTIWEETNNYQSIHLTNMNIGFNANENITVAVTQFSSAGTMDCIVKIRQGSSALTGNPVLGAGNETIGNVGINNIEYVSGNSGIDRSTNTLQTIDYAHHEIHSGSHYFYREAHSIAKNGTVDYLIVTPNTTKWAHLIIAIESVSSSVTIELYEDTVTSNNGTPQTPRNRNRNFGDNNTTLIFEAPTITSVGNLLSDSNFGAGKNSAGGGARDSEEIILKQNTKYLLRITEDNIQATMVNIILDWYEHTNKN